MPMRLEWFRNTSYTAFSRHLDMSAIAIGHGEYETLESLLLSKIGVEWDGRTNEASKPDGVN